MEGQYLLFFLKAMGKSTGTISQVSEIWESPRGIIFSTYPRFKKLQLFFFGASHLYFFSDTLEFFMKVLIPAKQKMMEEPQ